MGLSHFSASAQPLGTIPKSLELHLLMSLFARTSCSSTPKRDDNGRRAHTYSATATERTNLH